MKGYIKIVLLILISCCYVNTVFEFSDTEKKANFENETHIYVYQTILEVDITETKIQKQIDTIVFDSQPKVSFNPVVISKVTTNYNLHKYSEPPERRYILYASLLI